MAHYTDAGGPESFYQTNPAYESAGSDDDSYHDYIDPSKWQPNESVTAEIPLDLRTATQRRKQYAIAMDLLRELPSRNMMGSTEMQTDHGTENGTTLKTPAPKYNRQESCSNTMRFRSATVGIRNSSENADKVYQMLTKDPDATMENIKESLRNMNQCLTLKRSVKARLEHNDEQIQKMKQVSYMKKLKYRLEMSLQHAKEEAQDLFQSLDLWQSHLKVVQGHFGSGVASYFFFLRRLFYINFVAFVLMLSFIVVPQTAKTGSHAIVENLYFTGRELLTGGDFFNNTILYYGFYSNGTVANYNIPQAYFFTNFALIIIFLILLTYSLARSYRMNYVEVSGELKNIFSNKLFSAWDYSIETEDTARLKSHSIFNELLELLASERHDEEEKSCRELFRLYFWRVVINILIGGALCGTGYLTYELLSKEYILPVENSIMKKLTLSIVVSIIAFVVPMIFSAMSKWEGYASKQTEIYLNMCRIVLLRIVVLAVVTYFWLYQKDKISSSTTYENRTVWFFTVVQKVDKPVPLEMCWETQLGQEVYRLMLVDLFCIILLSTLGMELLRHLLHKWCCSFVGEPEFDIAQNTLDLIYTQTLSWLGFFYSPLLPLMTLIKLVIVFYVKRISVIQNCRPSLKPWRAAHAQTVFLMLTFINFLLTTVATGYSIFVIKPSSVCGPFRHMESRYATVLDLLYSIDESTVAKIFKHLVSPGVVAGIIIVLCVVVYYIRATAVAHEEMVSLLREQLIMEGKDKVFLLKLFKVAFQQADMTSLSENQSDNEPFDDPRGSLNSVNHHDILNEGYRDHSVQKRDYMPVESYDASLPQFPTGYLMANVPLQQQHQQPLEQTLQPKPGWGRLRERSPDTRSTSSQETPTSEWRRPSAVPVDGVSAEHLRGKFQDETHNGAREHSPFAEGSSKHSTPHEGSPYNRSDSGTPSGSLDRGRSDQLRAQRRNIPPVLPRPVHQHGFQYLTRDSPSYSPTRTSHHPTPTPKDSPRQRSFQSKQW